MSTSDYTVTKLLEELRKLPENAVLPSVGIIRYGIKLIYDCILDWYTLEDQNTSNFDGVLLTGGLVDRNLTVKQMIPLIAECVKINPDACVLRENAWRTCLVQDLCLEVGFTLLGSGSTAFPENLQKEKAETCKKILDAASNSKTIVGPTELSESLQKANIRAGVFTRVGRVWSNGSPYILAQQENRENLRNINSVFTKKVIGDLAFHTCNVLKQDFDVMFPVIKVMPDPDDSFRKALEAAPKVDEDGVVTTVSTYYNGEKIVERTLNGQLHGIKERYYSSGKLAGTLNYQNDNCHGKSIVWYENGQKRTEFNYENGEKHGPYTMWSENGEIEEEGEYVHDVQKKKPKLVPTKKDNRFTMAVGKRVLVVEKFGTLSVLLGAYDSSDLYRDPDADKLPAPTSDDCSTAKQNGISCLSSYV